MEQTFTGKEYRAQDNGARIVLFEADPGLRRSLALSLEVLGLAVAQAEDETSACRTLEGESADVFVIDHDSLKTCSDSFIDHLQEVRERRSARLLVTTTRRVKENWRARIQPDQILYKPYDVRYLYRRIVRLLGSETDKTDKRSIDGKTR